MKRRDCAGEAGARSGELVCLALAVGPYSTPYLGSRIPRRAEMLDLIIRGGQVMTRQGAGAWDVGIEGERITAVAQAGTLPSEGARIIDATGTIVSPGGVEPHAHLAHGIMSHP